MDIINEYVEIRKLYPLIKDTDAVQAYNLMQKSNVLKSYLDEQFVEANKEMLLLKNNIEIVKSRLSISGDAKNTTNGNRIAMASNEYEKSIFDYANKKQYCDLLERQVDFLKNVSFQMFSIWDSCKRRNERY